MTKKMVGKSSARPKNASKQIHKKPQVSKVKRGKNVNYFPVSSFTKKVISGGIVICAVVVLLSLIINTYYEPMKVAERKLAILAKDYYENYYYDRFVESLQGQDVSEAIEGLNGTGFSYVTLRHLLLFDNARNKDFSKFFENSSIVCDSSNTKMKILPREPYGKKDYDVEYTYSCNYK